MKPIRESESEIKYLHSIGMLTDSEKSTHHSTNKISLDEAIHKPEFWIVNSITLARLIAGAYAFCSILEATEKSQLAIPALLVTFTWAADYFDGKLARKLGVCTDEGGALDKVFTDFAMSIDTIYLIGKAFTL